ncbi:FGGY-family carbohydrate kinase [Lentilactobacillus senioris]|uniref:xylulokinase n=1 Tax=Lentilactobacillus senioris TaxID=931534 RepID=UPI00227EB5E3|nr:FGGY-family carbohydrate kinase [Lentilactobacillus senioris]MCY9805945.1 FGGY-family carbohydrate kinase [Lentilactobacillus senioris]
MNLLETSQAIQAGNVSLGIELGSTRIKAVLITADYHTVAAGSYNWENKLENNVWTYSLEAVWTGIQTSYKQLAAEVQSKYHQPITNIKSIGISAMMHGYLAFDQADNLLVPFRTWRNNITGQAADELTKLFNFNIPQRWTIAHLYQAILNDEAHVNELDFVTTLAGYVHWQLSGEKVLGTGDASGVFPIDPATGYYDQKMLDQFSAQANVKKYPWSIEKVLPAVKPAGQAAGQLTETGAKLLDPTGNLQGGSLMAPPEGDAGTGMVGTNSVRQRTGNISVGTSAFSMVVLDQSLKQVHRDIDMVMTPDGSPVAMVHVNNCSSDINAWTSLFGTFAQRLGVDIPADKLYGTLFLEATRADPNAGGLINYSYLSGENITKMDAGRPLFVRTPNSNFNLPNFMLTQLYAAFAPLEIGMEILTEEEGIQTDVMIAQGGLFKTPVIGQQVLANALNIPITIMENAGEGGPWGMAVLAEFAENGDGQDLADYLDSNVFSHPETMTLSPEPAGVTGYQEFLKNYVAALPVEGEAIKTIPDQNGGK